MVSVLVHLIRSSLSVSGQAKLGIAPQAQVGHYHYYLSFSVAIFGTPSALCSFAAVVPQAFSQPEHHSTRVGACLGQEEKSQAVRGQETVAVSGSCCNFAS